MVTGDLNSFSIRVPMSFTVRFSTTFRKSATGFLQPQRRGLIADLRQGKPPLLTSKGRRNFGDVPDHGVRVGRIAQDSRLEL